VSSLGFDGPTGGTPVWIRVLSFDQAFPWCVGTFGEELGATHDAEGQDGANKALHVAIDESPAPSVISTYNHVVGPAQARTSSQPLAAATQNRSRLRRKTARGCDAKPLAAATQNRSRLPIVTLNPDRVVITCRERAA
jgi:hypothetical protein